DEKVADPVLRNAKGGCIEAPYGGPESSLVLQPACCRLQEGEVLVPCGVHAGNVLHEEQSGSEIQSGGHHVLEEKVPVIGHFAVRSPSLLRAKARVRETLAGRRSDQDIDPSSAHESAQFATSKGPNIADHYAVVRDAWVVKPVGPH